MMGDVKVFKMISGEEIIGNVVSTDSLHQLYEVKNPAQIVLQRTETGMAVAMAPYMPYADGNINLYSTAIAADCSPDIKLVNEYNKLFGSGIQIAPASALAGLK
jgi:hypothetical protein